MPFSFDLDFGFDATNRLAGRLGCSEGSVHACLMSSSVQELIRLEGGNPANPFVQVGWVPVVDGIDLPAHVLELFRDGKTAAVPFMAGTNTNEANAFVYPAYRHGMNRPGFEEYAKTVLGNLPQVNLTDAELEKVYAMYPVPTGGDNREQAAALSTDATFHCRTRIAAAEYARFAAMYVYRYDHRLGCTNLIFKWMPGVFHGMEVPSVFGVPADLMCSWTRREAELSRRMQTIWTNFAKFLRPSTVGEVSCAFKEVPHYLPDQSSLVFRVPHDAIESGYRHEECSFWNALLSGPNLARESSAVMV